MASEIRRMEQMLETNGFTLHKQGGSHRVFGHPSMGLITLPSGTKVSGRWRHYLKSQIRQRCRAHGVEFSE